jgi:hypothetical protein
MLVLKTLINNRAEDYYLGKENGEYSKITLSGLRDFCEGRGT